MPTVSQGSQADVVVDPGKVLTVTTAGEAYVDRLTNLPDAGFASDRIVSGERVYLERDLPFSVRVRAISGAASYDVEVPPVAAADVFFSRSDDGAIDGLVDPATGSVIPLGGDSEGGLPEGGTDGQVLKIVSGSPAWAVDSNTTYTAMTGAEATTGTATTARSISANVLAGAINERLPQRTVPAGGTDGQVLKLASGAPAWGTDNNTTYSVVTTSANGLMSSGDKTKLDGIAESANAYTLPAATDAVIGGVKLGSATVQTVAATAVTATASRTYSVQANASGQAVVNVPWTNTTYAAATASTAGLVKQATAVSDATDETSAVTQLNALLAALRTSGALAST